MGTRLLAQELFLKGISKEIMDLVLVEGDFTDEVEVAKEALERKLRSWKLLDPQTLKRRVYGFLGRRGFSFDVIAKVIESLE